MSDPNMHATAHTLGRAHFNSSGFEGPWTWNPFSFDNGYGLARLERYGVCDRRLKAILFAHISGTTRRCSEMTAPSSSCPRTLHSSTYVSTRFDRTPHPQFASPHTKIPIPLQTYTQAPSMRKWVELYAADQKAFFEDYVEAHTKLSELGVEF